MYVSSCLSFASRTICSAVIWIGAADLFLTRVARGRFDAVAALDMFRSIASPSFDMVPFFVFSSSSSCAAPA